MTAEKEAQRAFINRVRTLYNIDKSVIDAALKEAGEEAWSFERWGFFMREPHRFLVTCDDPTADAIWRCVEARQRKPAPEAYDFDTAGKLCGYRDEKDGEPYCFAANCAPHALAHRQKEAQS